MSNIKLILNTYLKLKAKETEIKVGEKKGEWRFVLSPEIYGRLTEAKVIKEAALRSGVAQGVMQACWQAVQPPIF